MSHNMEQSLSNKRRFTASSLVAAIAITVGGFASGCGGGGPAIAPVSGEVRLDGKPLAEGYIQFASPTGFGAGSALKADGKFRFRSQYGNGIPLGVYRVAIVPPPPEGPIPMVPDRKAKKGLPISQIPMKYRDMGTSGLSADVKVGNNDFQFELKTQP